MGFLDTIKNKIEENNKKQEEKRLVKQKEKEEREAYLLDLSKGNNLPNVGAPILLQKNEICHLYCSVQRYETKTVTTGHVGGYSGVSFKVAKGVSFHTGGVKSRPIKEEVGVKQPGQLYVTNKRILFVSDKKNFTITYSKLIGVKPYSNGFSFQTDKTSYGILTNDMMYVGAILNGSVTNYLNEN